MTKKSGFNFQAGQVLLITVLVMIVGLTVSLAVVARSLTSVKISTQEEESQRAFYAAEAGLEEKLLPGANQGGGSFGNASYDVTFIQNPLTQFKFPDILNKDETQSLWLSAHNVNNDEIAPANIKDDYKLSQDLDICWNGDKPAMEMTFIWETTAGPKNIGLARAAFDPNGVRGSTNYFSSVGGGDCPEPYPYQQRIDFDQIFSLVPGGITNKRVIVIRLKPIYASAEVFVMGIGDDLPAQQKEIESLGWAWTGTPEQKTAQRKLKVFRAYPSLLPIFDFVLFSGTSLTK